LLWFLREPRAEVDLAGPHAHRVVAARPEPAKFEH